MTASTAPCPTAHAAADYSFETTVPQGYYKSTSYEDVYGSQYNYSGRNVVDYQIPELECGVQSPAMTGVMERTILPSLQRTVATGGGGYGVAGSGPITVLVEAGNPGSTTLTPTVPTTPTVQQPAYTSADGMAYKDGSIGSVKNLKQGDTITYTTIYGTRTYAVETVKIISNTAWSYLQATSDNLPPAWPITRRAGL